MLAGNYIRKLLIVLLFRISFRMAKKFGGRRRNYITKLARIVVAYLVRNCQKQICLLKELLYQIALARIAVASVVRNCKNRLAAEGIISESSLQFISQFFFLTTAKYEVLARGSIPESSLEFMLQVLLEPRKQSTYCIRMLTRIHVAIFLRTATKNKKLLAGGIQSESSRSNCDIANLDTTAKKNTM
jgi:hypothetical protein